MVALIDRQKLPTQLAYFVKNTPQFQWYQERIKFGIDVTNAIRNR
jgi:hypothetical protein